MLRRTALISVFVFSTFGLSGCSSLWSGIGSFSNYMAEKTQWASLPSLRGSKSAKTTAVQDDVTYTATVSETTPSDISVEMYDVSVTESKYDSAYEPTDTYDYTSITSPTEAQFDADGNYIDTSPIACPEGTYLTGDNTCMYLEQDDYSAEFTQ